MARARVLLLEDDPILLGVLRGVLEDASLDVTVCAPWTRSRQRFASIPMPLSSRTRGQRTTTRL